jgi:hypothetical protein
VIGVFTKSESTGGKKRKVRQMGVSTMSKGVRTAKSKSVIPADEQLMLLGEPQLLRAKMPPSMTSFSRIFVRP